MHPLTLEMIRKLADGLQLPADVLIRGYKESVRHGVFRASQVVVTPIPLVMG
jgi:hypothetical protein